MRWAGLVARMGEIRNAYNISIGNPVGKRQLRRPRCKWEDNIEADVKKIGYDFVDWIHVARDMARRQACGNTVMNLPVL